MLLLKHIEYKVTVNTKKSDLALCTDSFTLNEVILLINILIIKFNLNCTIQWNNKANGVKYPRIYIRANSIVKLQTSISKFLYGTFNVV